MTCPKFCNWFDNNDYIILLDHIEADIDITLILLLLFILILTLHWYWYWYPGWRGLDVSDLPAALRLPDRHSLLSHLLPGTTLRLQYFSLNTSCYFNKKIHFLNLALICILEAQTPLNHSLSIEMIFFLQNLSTNFREKFQVFALPLCQANFLLSVILMLTSLEIL